MKVTKKLFFVALLLSLILSIGAVVAQDNITFEQSNLHGGSEVSHETTDYDITSPNQGDVLNDIDENTAIREDLAESWDGHTFSDVQNAIESANDGDTIFLDGQTYCGGGVEIQVNKPLTIVGGSQSDQNLTATLDARKLSRIMNVTAGNVVIKGIRFINGQTNYWGGAIYWNAENGKILNSYFSNNSARIAGAIYGDCAKEFNISDCSFIDNSASFQAGTLFVVNGNFLITNCRFENNSANSDDGGAVLTNWCTVTIADCTFTKNYAYRFAGAIRNILAVLTVKNCTFENNTANERGGAIHGTSMTIIDSNFKNNNALYGGAVHGTCYITNSFFTGNFAGYGGAIASHDKLIITNNTFKDNDAEIFGSTIWVWYVPSNITRNFIDNSNSNIYAIYDSYAKSFIEDNNFTNPEKTIGYGELIIEFDENYACIGDNTISFPFIVYDMGMPGYGEVILQRIEKSSNGKILIVDFGKQTLVNGKASFDITLPSSSQVMNMYVIFNLSSQTISKSFIITVSDGPIVSITQNNDSDVLVVRLVSDATGIVMFEAGGKNYFAEISNDEAVIDVAGLENGRYAVNFIYSGDDNFPREEKIIIIDVRNAPTTVIDVNESFMGYAGRSIEIPVHVHDSSGNPLTGYVTLHGYATQELVGGKTTFTISLPNAGSALSLVVMYENDFKVIDVSVVDVSNGPIVSITQNNDSDVLVVRLVSDATGIVMFEAGGKNYFAEISNDEAVIDVAGLENGRYAVNFIYSGDDNFPREEKIIIIDVRNAPTTVIDVNESFMGYAGRSIEIPVHVHDSSGNPLTGYVTLHGYATQELVGGKTTFTISLPNAGSALSLVVMYENDFKVIDVSVVDESVGPKPILTQNKDISVAYSGKATYTVLISKDGKPLADENVIISFNGKNINVKTNSNGYALLNLDTNLKPGTYDVKATYDGVSVTNKVKITQIIKASDKKVKKSAKTTKIKISLVKVDGKYLVGKTLKVKFNSKVYKVKTNKKGVAIWKVKKSMLKKIKVGKSVKYTVAYGKDTLAKKLTIKK